MSAYPTTPGWATPAIRSLTFKTGILQAQNGTEQRWMLDTGVESFTLPYTSLKLADRDAILAFFETNKGSFGQTVSLQWLPSLNFTGLYFDTDELTFTEGAPGRFSGTVKLCTVVRAADTGTFGTFPVLASGAKTQLPYTKGSNFDTVAVRTEGGRYSYPKRNTAKHTWTAGGPMVNDAEALALWDFFRRAGGQYKSFSWTDPDSSSVFSSCRFASDTLEWRNLGPNQNQIVATIRELV